MVIKVSETKRYFIETQEEREKLTEIMEKLNYSLAWAVDYYVEVKGKNKVMTMLVFSQFKEDIKYSREKP